MAVTMKKSKDLPARERRKRRDFDFDFDFEFEFHFHFELLVFNVCWKIFISSASAVLETHEIETDHHSNNYPQRHTQQHLHSPPNIPCLLIEREL